jgi:hypothetical protein
MSWYKFSGDYVVGTKRIAFEVYAADKNEAITKLKEMWGPPRWDEGTGTYISKVEEQTEVTRRRHRGLFVDDPGMRTL